MLNTNTLPACLGIKTQFLYESQRSNTAHLSVCHTIKWSLIHLSQHFTRISTLIRSFLPSLLGSLEL